MGSAVMRLVLIFVVLSFASISWFGVPASAAVGEGDSSRYDYDGSAEVAVGAATSYDALETLANVEVRGFVAQGLRLRLVPDPLRTQIFDRNVQRYEDPLGPSADWLRDAGKSWDEIIESAARPGGQDLGF